MKTKRSFGFEALVLTASKVITLIISLANVMLLARFRTVEEYGTYSEILLVISLATTIFMLGVPNSINFFLPRAESNDGKRHFLSVYYTASTILSVITGILLVLISPAVVKYFHNESIRAFLYFFAIYPWINVVGASIDNVLIVYEKTAWLLVYRLVYSIVMILDVVAIKLLCLGFSEYMMLLIITSALLTLAVYYLASSLCGGIYFTLDKKLFREILLFSLPLGLASIVGTLNAEIDKLLIGYLMNSEQVAIYMNAAKELPITVIPSSISAILMPQIALLVKKNKIDTAVELWKNATELSFIFISVVVCGVFTFANEAVTFLYSEKYIAGVPVFRVYVLNLLFRVTYFSMFLSAYGHTKKIFICSIVSLLTNAVMNPLMYACFGMIGPAIATLGAIVVVMVLQLRMTSKITDHRIRDLFPWKNTFNNLLINIGFSIVFFFISNILPLERVIGNVAEAMILGIIWILCYFAFVQNNAKMLWDKLKGE